MFDIKPVIGRFFTAEEDVPPAGTRVAVLSYAYWQTEFGGRKEALGTLMDIGPAKYTIIGVAPEGFNGFELDPVVAFVPVSAENDAVGRGGPQTPWYSTYNMTWFEVFARRKPGVTEAAATTDLTNAYRQSYQKQVALNPKNAPFAVAKPHAMVGPVLRDRGPNEGSDAKVASWLDRRRRDGASHRVRQRRQSFARARAETPARDRRPHRARREPRATADATAHRESAAGGARRRAGSGDRAVGRPRDAAAAARPGRFRTGGFRGFAASVLRHGARDRRRGAHRTRPGVSDRQRRRRVGAQGRRARGRRTPIASSGRTVDRAGGALRRAADRRGPVPAQPVQRRKRAHGLRRRPAAVRRRERARREARFAPEHRAATGVARQGAVAARGRARDAGAHRSVPVDVGLCPVCSRHRFGDQAGQLHAAGWLAGFLRDDGDADSSRPLIRRDRWRACAARDGGERIDGRRSSGRTRTRSASASASTRTRRPARP